jgi:hypothetical protein
VFAWAIPTARASAADASMADEQRPRRPPWPSRLRPPCYKPNPTTDTPKPEDAMMPLHCHWCEPSSLCHHRHSARAAPAHGHSHEPPLAEPRLLEDACRPPATLPPPLTARAPPLPAGAVSRPPSLLSVSQWRRKGKAGPTLSLFLYDWWAQLGSGSHRSA